MFDLSTRDACLAYQPPRRALTRSDTSYQSFAERWTMPAIEPVLAKAKAETCTFLPKGRGRVFSTSDVTVARLRWLEQPAP
jgi:hypothetical protein